MKSTIYNLEESLVSICDDGSYDIFGYADVDLQIFLSEHKVLTGDDLTKYCEENNLKIVSVREVEGTIHHIDLSKVSATDKFICLIYDLKSSELLNLLEGTLKDNFDRISLLYSPQAVSVEVIKKDIFLKSLKRF